MVGFGSTASGLKVGSVARLWASEGEDLEPKLGLVARLTGKQKVGLRAEEVVVGQAAGLG